MWRNTLFILILPFLLVGTLLPTSSSTAAQISAPIPTAPGALKELKLADIAKLPFGPERQKLLEEGSKKERTVNLYSGWREAADIVAPFIKRYPWLKVGTFVPGTAVLVERVLAEAKARNPGADVVNGEPIATIPLQDLLQTFTAAGATSPKDLPEAAIVSANMLIWVYSTERVAKTDIPRVLNDILKERWRNKLGLYSAPNTFAAQWTGALIEFFGEDWTKTFLREVHGQNPSFYSTGAGGAQGIARGEFDLAFSSRASMWRTKADGAPIDWIVLDPTYAYLSYIGILKEAKHPCAGMLFIDWLFSDEGQKSIESVGHVRGSDLVKGVVEGRKLQRLRLAKLGDQDLMEGWSKIFETYAKGR